MPVTAELIADIDLCHIRAQGAVALDELRDARRDMASRLRSGGAYREFFELSHGAQLAVDVTPLAVADLAEDLARQLDLHDQTGHVVILAPDDRPFASARVFATHAGYLGKIDVTVVRAPVEAVAALTAAGVPGHRLPSPLRRDQVG